ncbi:MAG: pyruvate kinase [Deltaproteobacteria bacterium]|nr:pyruvate kinase [Deltaproteobacteria bacterium]
MFETRAKIVCTLGPSSNDYETIKKLLNAGMKVARLNLSHGSHADHIQVISHIRRASEDLNQPVAILMDLQGPKIRVGRFKGGEAQLEEGRPFTITNREMEGTSEIVSTTYTKLPGDVRIGDTILMDDGLLALRVERKNETDVVCTVEVGGLLKNNKGINLPGVPLSVESLSAKDREDLDLAIRENLDYVAMSFVRHPNDITTLRALMKEKGKVIPIVAKIEKPEALTHIDAIIDVTDAIMVARGDLGVEIPAEEVPAIQKRIIHRCNHVGKPVITATQMLDSMVSNARPTRAEASDVANAILDGTDAVMLSAETASGKYPIEAVSTMNRIIRATELSLDEDTHFHRFRRWSGELHFNAGIAISACTLSEQVDARAIACITGTGAMAQAIAKHRPVKPIFAISHSQDVLRRLCLVWGIEGIIANDLSDNIDEAVLQVESILVKQGCLNIGDKCVLTAGLPFAEHKATNMVRVDLVL